MLSIIWREKMIALWDGLLTCRKRVRYTSDNFIRQEALLSRAAEGLAQ